MAQKDVVSFGQGHGRLSFQASSGEYGYGPGGGASRKAFWVGLPPFITTEPGFRRTCGVPSAKMLSGVLSGTGVGDAFL